MTTPVPTVSASPRIWRRGNPPGTSITTNGWKEIGFRLAEVDRFLGAPSVGFNWTYKPDANLNVNFSVNNILIASRTRVSDYFSGPRNVSPLTEREIEINYARPNFYFSVRKTFH